MFEKWLDEVESIILALRAILADLEAGAVTPEYAVQRFEQHAKELYVREADADRWRDAHNGRIFLPLPRGYDHASCCKMGAMMFVLEAAIMAIVSDMHLELGQWEGAAEFADCAAGTLDRAQQHLAELKWFRRLFSRGTPNLGGMEDIRNTIRTVRDIMSGLSVALELKIVDDVNDHIREFNEHVIRDTVNAILRSGDGSAPELPSAQLSDARHVLRRLQLDLTRFRSSWSVLGAMERVSIASAALNWARFNHYRQHPRSVLLRDDAIRAFASAEHYRRRRRHLVIWYILKAIYRTLSSETAPKWTDVLPREQELPNIRASMREWFDRKDP